MKTVKVKASTRRSKSGKVSRVKAHSRSTYKEALSKLRKLERVHKKDLDNDPYMENIYEGGQRKDAIDKLREKVKGLRPKSTPKDSSKVVSRKVYDEHWGNCIKIKNRYQTTWGNKKTDEVGRSKVRAYLKKVPPLYRKKLTKDLKDVGAA